jgi:uncharacterized protein DUF4255
MIKDLSESMRALLTRPGLPPGLAAAQIAFERPAENFNPTQTTLDLFLFDLRENRHHRNAPAAPGPADRSPMMLACSYLITAWCVGGAEIALQEQQLLGETLQVLTTSRVLPAATLRGALAGQTPLPELLLQPPDALMNSSEFWSALGNKLRPALSVTVTIAVPALPSSPEV